MTDFFSSQSQWAIVGRQSPKDIMKQYGKSYYLATKFINPRKKHAIYNLYKLVRIPDLVVDDHKDHTTNEQKKETLTRLRAHRHTVLNEHQYDDVFFGSVARMVHEMKLNTEWIEAFWDAMEQDTAVSRYHTRSELCHYMYGSAEVV
jgi:phytoene synthase